MTKLILSLALAATATATLCIYLIATQRIVV